MPNFFPFHFQLHLSVHFYIRAFVFAIADCPDLGPLKGGALVILEKLYCIFF